MKIVIKGPGRIGRQGSQLVYERYDIGIVPANEVDEASTRASMPPFETWRDTEWASSQRCVEMIKRVL